MTQFDFVRPDQFYPIKFDHPLNLPSGEELVGVYVNAKYDSVHYFKQLGFYMLKVYDDEEGLMGICVEDDAAQQVIDFAELPLVEREFMYESEHNTYTSYIASRLNDALFGGFDETVIKEFDEND